MTSKNKLLKPIVLTSHPTGQKSTARPIHWGARDPKERGPIVGTLTDPTTRNCIGTHSGSYSVYRALAVASGSLDPHHVPDLTNTSPTVKIGPFESWFNPERIVSMDPWGAEVGTVFKECIDKGLNIQPTIAITRAHIAMPEVVEAIKVGKIPVDGEIVGKNGDCLVTKAAIEPVWITDCP